MWLRLHHYHLIFILLTAVSLCGCSDCGCPGCGCAGRDTDNISKKSRPVVAATNSYLQTALADLTAGMDGGLEILPLAGPGACPGHFDLRPSQIERLAECRLLVRFDFQTSLAEKLSARVGKSLPVTAVSIPGGMCRPSTYIAACRQIADSLVEAGCLDRATADARLAQITARMETLSHWTSDQIAAAGLGDYPVVASKHQESFCRWLSLRVVVSFNGSETRPSRIDAAIADAQAGDARLLIANLPEGRRMADMLADRLGITTVVFGNFPGSDSPTAFDELVRGNVNKLVEAAERVGNNRVNSAP